MKANAMVTFLIEKDELNQVVKRLKIIQKVYKGRKKALMCEVTVKDGCIEISVPGLFQVLSAQSSGACKFTLPFTFFTKVVATYEMKFINFIVTAGKVEMENFICKANTTFFEDDSVLRSLQLPINFQDGDLLPLSAAGYTVEELQFNHMVPQIERAKKRLVKDLQAASQMLAGYNISYLELKAFVCKKLNIDPRILLEYEKSGNAKALKPGSDI